MILGRLNISLKVCLFAIGAMFALGQDKTPLSREDAKKLVNPVLNTRASIGKGRSAFMRIPCTGCHGEDGKALVDAVADATDLTAPKMFKSGTSEGEIYRSIKEGAGNTMPPYKFQIKQEDVFWHLVNFIRSLWPEGQRPAVQEEKKD